MNLLPFFEWCEQTAIGVGIRESAWLFPVIESVHLIGLAALGGAVLVVDLRLLGIGLRDHPVSDVAREMRPWLIGSVVLMLATGLLLFLSEAVKCYFSDAFRFKMAFLSIALTFTFTVRRRVTTADAGAVSPGAMKLTACLSLALWLAVAAAGRWIGFS